MRIQKLIQTDQRRLDFWGDELYKGSTKKDRDDIHWSVVRIFRAKDCWVVGIARMTTLKLEERDLFAAFEARNKEEVVAIVNKAVPELTDNVAGVLRWRGDKERLRKELGKWKKRNPMTNGNHEVELLLLNEKEGSPEQAYPQSAS
jgi:hypothetical protein